MGLFQIDEMHSSKVNRDSLIGFGSVNQTDFIFSSDPQDGLWKGLQTWLGTGVPVAACVIIVSFKTLLAREGETSVPLSAET